MRARQVPPIWDEDDRSARCRGEEVGELGGDAGTEELRGELVDFAELDERVVGIDERAGLQGRRV